MFCTSDLVKTVSWQRAFGVAVGLGSVGLGLHTVTGVLGKETVGMSQAGMAGNTKALGTGRTCNSFDLSLLTVYLPSSSLLQSFHCCFKPHSPPYPILPKAFAFVFLFLPVQLLLCSLPASPAPRTRQTCCRVCCHRCSPRAGLILHSLLCSSQQACHQITLS